ncbi:hypothetical protein CWL40_004476 [Vibrio parahaemolyticus]|nr:hypothetical protein [Vibrio parahaemolyticus]
MVSLIESKSGYFYKMGLYLSLGWGVAQLLIEAITRLADLFWFFVFGAVG